jgi:tetratricopeptide (TPR) repeat protein
MKFIRNTAILITFASAISCTPAKETTAYGAATGGAIGAGLGAIVGNQTGDPGSGLVLGTVAGSATGALIGNALQAQQEKVDRQEAVIAKHENVIKAQRSELDELRRMGQDPTASGSSLGNANPPLERDLGVGPSVGSQSLNQQGPIHLNPPKLDGARASASSLTSYSQPPVPRSDTVVKPVANTNIATEQTETTTVTRSAFSAEQANPVEDTTALVPAAPADEKAGVAWENTSAAAVVPQGAAPSGDCVKAQEEVGAVESSSDPADKLYHYRRALRLCPDNSPYHNGLGEIYLSLKRPDDAEFEFREAVRLDAGNAQAKKNLAAATTR